MKSAGVLVLATLYSLSSTAGSSRVCGNSSRSLVQSFETIIHIYQFFLLLNDLVAANDANKFHEHVNEGDEQTESEGRVDNAKKVPILTKPQAIIRIVLDISGVCGIGEIVQEGGSRQGRGKGKTHRYLERVFVSV